MPSLIDKAKRKIPLRLKKFDHRGTHISRKKPLLFCSYRVTYLQHPASDHLESAKGRLTLEEP
jgi:hypothetical protein